MAKRLLNAINKSTEIADQKQGLEGLEKISFKINNSSIKEKLIKEKRTEVLQIKLFPSEKKKFFALIGDETGSDVGRFLIQEFIKNNSQN